MADTNVVILVGRLTRDVELKYTAGGMAIGNGSLAIDRQTKKDGNWVKEANFFEFAVFGKQAENLKPYLVKGKQIAITGFLKQDRWQDQEGLNRSKITVVANNIQLVGGRSEGQTGTQDQAGYGDGFQEDTPYGND